MKNIRTNGFTFGMNNDNTATAKLVREHEGGEIIVPSEINGRPIVTFYFYPKTVKNKIKIERIILPTSVKEFICDNFFDHTIEIEIDENNPYLFSDGKAVYTKDRSELICFFAREDTEYSIQTGCRTIANRAFNFSKKLKHITFPEGLRLIREYAFCGCRELAGLELPEGLVKIEEFAFHQCPRFDKIVLPSTLEYIGDQVLNKGSRAHSVQLPKALSHIGIEAFPDNWALELSAENKNFIVRDGLLLSCDGKKAERLARLPENGVLVIPEYVTEISPYAFTNNSKIRKVIMPKGHLGIGHHAFQGCVSLEKLTLTADMIGAWAFFDARGLKEIVFENVKEIGDYAFGGCNSLEKISLKCDKLGDGAFELCRSLRKIDLKCDDIGKEVFMHCRNLTEAEVDCERTGDSMFGYCVTLSKVVLKNTRIIGQKTFTYTLELKELVFPPELEAIEDKAFLRTGLRPLTIPKTVRWLKNDIADYVTDIHIYDNILSDISPENDISSSAYNLYVHSAETGEIRYAVPIPVSRRYHDGSEHRLFVNMFKGGASFDFKEFDRSFGDIYEIIFRNEKFLAGVLRLKYGYELDEVTRRGYEEQLCRLAYPVVMYFINENETEKFMDPEVYRYMSMKELLRLVDISAERHMTELTALLLQICNERRAKPDDKD